MLEGGLKPSAATSLILALTRLSKSSLAIGLRFPLERSSLEGVQIAVTGALAVAELQWPV